MSFLSMDYIEKIQQYLEAKFSLKKRGIQLTENSLLLEEKIIDSMGIMELLLFVEDTFNIEVPEDDISPENFGTIKKLANYVMKLSNAT